MLLNTLRKARTFKPVTGLKQQNVSLSNGFQQCRSVWSFFKPAEDAKSLSSLDETEPLVSRLALERTIPRLKKLTPENFYKQFRLKGRPVIITGVVDKWPALTKWNDPNYFSEHHGKTYVPIEVGNSYLDPNVSQKMLPFKDFIETYVTLTNKRNINPETGKPLRMGYLAQHQLFAQIPKLSSDFSTPEHCSQQNDTLNMINGWIGPKGTVSPLHKDPYHNLLGQAVGYKYVRLYHASDSDKLYPFSDPFFKNTSQVDVQNPNYELYPEAKDLEYLETVLKPGELLYIPKGTWHYLKSVSYSCSVNFWFTGKDVL